MFEMDFAENKHMAQQSLSKEDKRFLNIAETRIYRRDDGHYELPLPLKESFKGLPNNRDDGLKSVATAASAVELVKNVKAMCHQGGFNLHKFLSNSKEVIKNIPESDRAEGVKEIDLDLDELPLERTLGVQWRVESDSFEFSVVLQDKPCTRRGILSTVSSIYDPIGFVAPWCFKESQYCKSYAVSIWTGTIQYQKTRR